VVHEPLYEARFNRFLVESDDHLLIVLRYVERNALGAGLVERAEQWRWGLWAKISGDGVIKGILSPWPYQRPKD